MRLVYLISGIIIGLVGLPFLFMSAIIFFTEPGSISWQGISYGTVFITISYFCFRAYFRLLKRDDTKTNEPKPVPLTWFHYLIAAFSFIPLLGVPIGVVCGIYGGSRRTVGGYAMAAMGFAGVLSTFIIYSALQKQVENPTGKFAEAKSKLISLVVLPDIIRRIELHKVNTGSYPENVDVLGDEIKEVKASYGGTVFGDLYYRREGDHYFLLFSGPDKAPFTRDDVLPDIAPEDLKKTGFRVNP